MVRVVERWCVNVVRMHDGSGMTARGGVPAGAMMTKRSRTGAVPRATDHDPPPQRGVIGEYTREEGGDGTLVEKLCFLVSPSRESGEAHLTKNKRVIWEEYCD